MSNENPQADSMKLAHVLFMDIVGYPKLPIDEQTSAIHILQEIVNGTTQVARAKAANELTSIPTGDGMALVFFSEPTNPVECALQVGKALKVHPEIQLRMGVHSGPVNEHRREWPHQRRRLWHQHGAAGDGQRRCRTGRKPFLRFRVFG